MAQQQTDVADMHANARLETRNTGMALPIKIAVKTKNPVGAAGHFASHQRGDNCINSAAAP